MIEFEIPVRTVNPTNNRQHWRVVWRRSKDQRRLASSSLTTPAMAGLWAQARVHLPAVVTLTRISPGTLDDDNLRPALKSIRDGIADAFGVADNDPRIEWRYDQAKAKRGQYGVRVCIQPKGDA